jgi:hypothetical protein
MMVTLLGAIFLVGASSWSSPFPLVLPGESPNPLIGPQLRRWCIFRSWRCGLGSLGSAGMCGLCGGVHLTDRWWCSLAVFFSIGGGHGCSCHPLDHVRSCWPKLRKGSPLRWWGQTFVSGQPWWCSFAVFFSIGGGIFRNRSSTSI